MRDVAPGLWIWSAEHPDWEAGQGWEPRVWSTCAASGGEVHALDPLDPPAGSAARERLDARPPTAVVILKPDHVRDRDGVACRYGAEAYGPGLEPGTTLPGGAMALDDGRGRGETPLWLPEQRALVFADGLTAPEGELRVWSTPWHEARTLPALRAMLELPFETVIVSHGEPVHDRKAFAAALRRAPYEEGNE